MSKENHGGPAFPHIRKPVAPGVEEVITSGGMSLRDYFAAKVLQGVMASGTSMSIGTNHEEEMLDMARAFYSMADAMIKARELP